MLNTFFKKNCVYELIIKKYARVTGIGDAVSHEKKNYLYAG
jgi:hypothetical protein